LTQIEVRCDGDHLSVQTFPIGRAIIGRSPDNEIYIKSKFVSRHHAQIVTDEDGCVIEDLNSTNGVFIGERQVKKHRLRSGDVITLGVHELVYTNLATEDTSDVECIEEDLPEENDEASVVGE